MLSGSRRLSKVATAAGRFVHAGAFIGIRKANRGSGTAVGSKLHCTSPLGGNLAVFNTPDCDPDTRNPLPICTWYMAS